MQYLPVSTRTVHFGVPFVLVANVSYIKRNDSLWGKFSFLLFWYNWVFKAQVLVVVCLSTLLQATLRSHLKVVVCSYNEFPIASAFKKSNYPYKSIMFRQSLSSNFFEYQRWRIFTKQFIIYNYATMIKYNRSGENVIMR